MLAVAKIQALIEAIEQNTALQEEAQFAERTDILHMMELHVLDPLSTLTTAHPHNAQIFALCNRAHTLRNTLIRMNAQLCQRLRTHIATGNYDHLALLRECSRYSQGSMLHKNDDFGYDSLDVLMNGILRIDSPPEEPDALEEEMIPYQPTPMRLIFEMVQRTQLNHSDVFYDIGSGLGHVAIVVSLISGARTVGIEVQPAYCAYARRCATTLNLARVSFRQQDARKAAFSDGTLFYLYTPFHGTMLQAVLDRLHGEANQRDICICTYGPCTATVNQQDWLTAVERDTFGSSPIALFQSSAR
jgi:hypothetical protein